ncbi:MAG: hypothetical protein WD342_08955 [Verrucomicrobiales bacterium]
MSIRISKIAVCALSLGFLAGCENEEFEAQPERVSMAEPLGYQYDRPVDATRTLEETFSNVFKRDGVLGGDLDLHGFILIETDHKKLSRDVTLKPGIESFRDFVVSVIGQTNFEVRFVDQVAIITPPNYEPHHQGDANKPEEKEYYQMNIPFLNF